MRRIIGRCFATRIAIVAVIALTACAPLVPRQMPSESEMMTAATALTKVSAAVEANLRYGEPDATISDADYLVQSVAHDPHLLAPLAHYQVTLRRRARHSDILVCSADGQLALLEDAGCTAILDSHLWRKTPALPCAFTLDLTQICPSRPN